jgi:hypothetical protein
MARNPALPASRNEQETHFSPGSRVGPRLCEQLKNAFLSWNWPSITSKFMRTIFRKSYFVLIMGRIRQSRQKNGYFPARRQKIPIRCNKAQKAIILRNCIPNKTQPLATKLAKAVPVHPKLFHVEQFWPSQPKGAGVFILRSALAGRTEVFAPLKIGKSPSEMFHVEQFSGRRFGLTPEEFPELIRK